MSNLSLFFPGFSNREIYQKVCKEKFKEMLPEDCPESLGDLINACRAYDNFQRPSAGGKSETVVFINTIGAWFGGNK